MYCKAIAYKIFSGTTGEDLWTPFKELQSLVERAVSSEDDSILDHLQKALQKHKQNFLTLLKNPVCIVLVFKLINSGAFIV